MSRQFPWTTHTFPDDLCDWGVNDVFAYWHDNPELHLLADTSVILLGIMSGRYKDPDDRSRIAPEDEA